LFVWQFQKKGGPRDSNQKAKGGGEGGRNKVPDLTGRKEGGWEIQGYTFQIPKVKRKSLNK